MKRYSVNIKLFLNNNAYSTSLIKVVLSGDDVKISDVKAAAKPKISYQHGFQVGSEEFYVDNNIQPDTFVVNDIQRLEYYVYLTDGMKQSSTPSAPQLTPPKDFLKKIKAKLGLKNK